MAEREKNGRFAKGNVGGPGNPLAGQVAKLRAVVLACLDEETMRVVVQAMIRQAMRGDVAAAKLLFQYSLGKPIEVPLPETEEKEEEADSKREETEASEQSDTVNKREETASAEQGGTVNKREETAETVEASTVNKRRETAGFRTMGVDGPGEVGQRVRELFGELVELWREDTGQNEGTVVGGRATG